MAAVQVNWGIYAVYFCLLLSIGVFCGYLAGKIAESASMSFSLFFITGFLLGPLGILIAAIARSTRKRRVGRRLSVVETRLSVETPGYYQPDFLGAFPYQVPLPSPAPRNMPLEGMGKCDGCNADNPRENEFCWRCGEYVGLRKEA